MCASAERKIRLRSETGPYSVFMYWDDYRCSYDPRRCHVVRVLLRNSPHRVEITVMVFSLGEQIRGLVGQFRKDGYFSLIHIHNPFIKKDTCSIVQLDYWFYCDKDLTLSVVPFS